MSTAVKMAMRSVGSRFLGQVGDIGDRYLSYSCSDADIPVAERRSFGLQSSKSDGIVSIWFGAVILLVVERIE